MTQRHPGTPFGMKWACTGGSAIAAEDTLTAAVEEANARGSGVASLKGKMIDKPVVTRARRLLDLYEAGSKIDEVEEI